MTKYFSRIMILVAVVLFVAMLFPSTASATRIPVSLTVNTALPTWGGVSVTLEVTTNGSGDTDNWWSTSYRYNDTGPWLCMDHDNHTNDGTYSETMDFITPIVSGTHTLNVQVHQNNGCSTGTVAFPDNLEPSITVAENNPAFPATCGIDLTFVIDESGSLYLGDPPIVDDMRHAADVLWKSLEGTGSTMSIVEFNTEGRVVPSVQSLDVLPGANYTTFTDYLSPTTSIQSADTYSPEAYGPNDYYTNWEDAFLDADGVDAGDPNDLLIFLTDGVPTTNNNFPTTDDPDGDNINDGETHMHTGPAALASYAIKDGGTRVLGLGVPNPTDPTINMPFFSGPTPYMTTTMNIAEADYATIQNVENLGAALHAIVLELCQGSVTVNKLVNNPDDPEGPYIFADGWEFTATASPTGSPFAWTAPYASNSNSISGTTGSGSNVTGTLTFQWDPQDSLISTTVSITETAQPDYEFLDVSCQNQLGVTVVFTQTTLPVVLPVESNEFIVCAFRNYKEPTAITLEDVGIGTGQATWIFVAVAALAVFTAGVIVVLRRKESMTT